MSQPQPTLPPALTIPTLHLNGSGGQQLAEQIEAAQSSLFRALNDLAFTAPNARDYYPQGDQAFTAACYEHRLRVARVQDVLAELATVHTGITKQLADRQAQRDQRVARLAAVPSVPTPEPPAAEAPPACSCPAFAGEGTIVHGQNCPLHVSEAQAPQDSVVRTQIARARERDGRGRQASAPVRCLDSAAVTARVISKVLHRGGFTDIAVSRVGVGHFVAVHVLASNHSARRETRKEELDRVRAYLAARNYVLDARGWLECLGA